jgi:D-alanine-D-alanine ligase
MKIGLSYDLKADMPPGNVEDALEEYDAPETIVTLTAALESLGHSVTRLGGGREFLVNILSSNVDLVFNIAEGRGTYKSREAQVPSALEMLGIPYSGSDPQCLAICLDKPLTKILLQAAGIRTPKWRVVNSSQELKAVSPDAFPLPAFVKPACEGSSKGIRLNCRAETPEQVIEVTTRLLEQYQQPVIVEEFIAGDEVTVGVGGLPPRVIGIMRILPQQGRNPEFVYSLEVKRDWEKLVRYECPAQLPPKTMREIAQMSLATFAVLGCRDISRIDFRVDTGGKPYIIEINPLPGLRPGYSDLPIMAQKMGMEYNELISLILSAALKRQELCLEKSA